MSFLYPSLITVSRPNDDTAAGVQQYGGLQETNETIIIQNLRAHIEADRQGTAPTAKLPGDAAGESIWRIIFKDKQNLVRSRDFITDDTGRRFQVIAPDNGPLVTTCRCQIMET